MMKKNSNIHTVSIYGPSVEVAILSDVHWDNPKCDHNLLKMHLDYCLKHNIKVFFNGDTFCLMQGKGDRRGNKSDIRAEHNNAFYFDSIVDTAVDFFMPYADIILGFGYGNHETAIIKYQETDILKRFVDLLNAKSNKDIFVGGYGGWVLFKHYYEQNDKNFTTHKMKYYHGSGGGGIVTKGAINLTRALDLYEGFDIFTMGHIHENWARNDVRETVECSPICGYSSKLKDVHLMITGTYKEEYGDGSKGWHVERGAPPKPLGGRILKISARRKMVDKERNIITAIDSYKFPVI